MKAGIVGKFLGASAALALAAPVIAIPAAAFAAQGSGLSGYSTSTPVHRRGTTFRKYYGYAPTRGMPHGYPPYFGYRGSYAGYYGSSGPATYPYRSYYGYGASARAGSYVVSAGALNMRVGPSDAAPVRTVLPGGTRVRMAGPDVHGWYRVASPYGMGWVYSEYLSPPT
jgi:uncharacterized protein YgiM (DUF1202 family)